MLQKLLSVYRNASWVRFKRWWYDLKHPYRRKFKKRSREILRACELSRLAHENRCPHLQGSLGQTCHTLTSIVWHLFEDGVKRGVCTGCLRKFLPSDSDYSYWLNKRSGNRLSTGLRKVDVADVQRAYPMPAIDTGHPLDELSDNAIDVLMKQTQKYLREHRCPPPSK